MAGGGCRVVCNLACRLGSGGSNRQHGKPAVHSDGLSGTCLELQWNPSASHAHLFRVIDTDRIPCLRPSSCAGCRIASSCPWPLKYVPLHLETIVPVHCTSRTLTRHEHKCIPVQRKDPSDMAVDVQYGLKPVKEEGPKQSHRYSALGLADLLCPDFELCNRPYFLKIDDSVMVGYTRVVKGGQHQAVPSTYVYNLVMVLNTEATSAAQLRYQQLAQRLGSAFNHEELRCGYLSEHIRSRVNELDAIKLEGLDVQATAVRAAATSNALANTIQDLYSKLKADGRAVLKVGAHHAAPTATRMLRAW
ncbi:uncharacterized protein MONBRDRAFT_9586 [Monosiga brevicollis MX1]|uniref:Uncharacterized protein n=1 Tax=Monosiga brevicollis TaxID=81824 RepID=A9V3S2_MONBE|nr:uncharacterized protein MONBRDRAFT_9586 [Monosiga brevicollis MX1]EDQ87755.1 predicted protein [Monosiga brevicollis MX1]|eukprot:XP_001747288.1 hypothetical protein [Monosiga brevicollis MX1]